MVGAIGFLPVLHEYIIPDLEVLAALASWLAVRTACGASRIEEHLRIRAARTGLACRSPPVILTWHEIDMGRIDPELYPSCSSLLIAGHLCITLKDSDRKAVHRYPEDLREELKAIAYHLFLEVITERPVAKHLEECEMMRIAYAIDITGTDALLVIRKPCACRMLCSEDIWNKRMHSCCSKEDSRIILRNQ